MLTIRGPLYAEVMGPAEAPPMLFVHPNPLDSSCWLYQMAHFSTWYRCIAVDLPGYGRSPSAGSGLSMRDMADACWEAVDRATPEGSGGGTVLVGCSVGSDVVQHMYHLRPSQTHAVVLTGAGWHRVKPYPPRRIAAYRERGVEYRYEYALEDLSEEFRHGPLAHWLARLISERNASADVETIIRIFEALAEPEPAGLQAELRAPVLILAGSEDRARESAFALLERLPSAELATIEGAGHVCQVERPWIFDWHVMSFLQRQGRTDLPVALPVER